MSFINLNVVTDFSLQSATSRISQIVKKAKADGQPALAITDIGNLFGAVQFYSECMANGIKPILGSTMHICENHEEKKSSKQNRYTKLDQVILLAKNQKGWQSLMMLSSIAYMKGFYYVPRIDYKLLAEYGEGVIVISNGLNSDLASLVKKGDMEGAVNLASLYKKYFGDNFFIGIERNGVVGEADINNELLSVAMQADTHITALAPSRFVEQEDFEAFKAIMALRTNKTITPNAKDSDLNYFNENFYFKTQKEVERLFSDLPSAIESTHYIANVCNVDMKFGEYHMPLFDLEGSTPDEKLREIAVNGLNEKWDAILRSNPSADRKEYENRLVRELGVLSNMGFSSYFLVVQDFIRWAKENGIPVGPGRGSGAGSLVAYTVGITNLDPIPYGLLFERFLNPERVSMPDFDIDFCRDRRGEVIDYVEERYGSEQVAQIVNYGTMKAKAAIRDIGRVYGVDYGLINYLAKLIPDDLGMTLDKALEYEPRIEELLESSEEAAHVYEIAKQVEGNNRHLGKHAAGVIISSEPVVNVSPLCVVSQEEGAVVQWDMKYSEKVGLIKFDFLGLKTLTIINKAEKLIQQDVEDFSVDGIFVASRNNCPEKIGESSTGRQDVDRTFKLFQSGKTSGVFQLESEGMQGVMVDMGPTRFEDLIALVALYRPGPLETGMVTDYIKVKRGEKSPEYPHPSIQDILEETNGVIVYQEQVMQIAQRMAGYSLGQADLLRRAMGKKKPEEMEKQRAVFIEGCLKNNISEDEAGYVFDLMETFAGYGFNKSHSAAYALISYQTAYLKANYPRHYMAAAMTCDAGNDEKLQILVADCRNNLNIPVYMPDINVSRNEFTLYKDGISYGFSSIKGVSSNVAMMIEQEREENGHFTSVGDLLARCKINKKVLESLINSGAMDSLISNRNEAIMNIENYMKESKFLKKVKAQNQSTLFDIVSPEASSVNLQEYPARTVLEDIQIEKEMFGFYPNRTPYSIYSEMYKGRLQDRIEELVNRTDYDIPVCLPVMLDELSEKALDSGLMAFGSMSDGTSSTRFVVFPRSYESVRQIMKDEPVFFVKAIKRRREGHPDSIIIDKAFTVEDYLNVNNNQHSRKMR